MFVLLKNIIHLILFCIVYCSDNLANEILLKAIEKHDGINCNFDLTVVKKQKEKPDKIKQYDINIFHPKNDSLHRMIRIDTIKPLNLSDVSYWEHDYGEGGLVKRWFTLPLTGKLKELKGDGKPSGDFNLNDIMINLNNVLNKSNVVIQTSSDISTIEIGGKVKQHISIEMDTYRILEVEIFNKYNRVVKAIKFTKYFNLDNFSIPQLIEINDKKKKVNFIVTLEGFKKRNDFSETFFLPRDKYDSN
tara:strand:- start:285 stop:1025 length:741 start_codon:yes stop_codon:yes gene_type:complete